MSFPTVYDNPYLGPSHRGAFLGLVYFPLYRHAIYSWKALDLNFKDMKEGGAPLWEVRRYWGIYGSQFH